MTWAIGCYSIECNSFASTVSDRAYFEQNGHLLFGEDIKAYHRDVRTELCAFIDFCRETKMEYVPVISATAVPHGTVTLEMFHLIADSFIAVLDKDPSIEGVYVALHGSSLVDTIDDPEGELLELLRKKLGNRPLIASLDFHANVTKKMVDSATVLVGWNDFPHTHIYEAGMKAARAAWDIMQKGWEDIRTVYIKIPAIIPLELLTTVEEDEPVTKIIRKLESLESDDAILAASFFGVHIWLDIDEMGPCFTASVRTSKLQHVKEELEAMSQAFWDSKDELYKITPVSIPRALELAQSIMEYPILFNEPSDNVGGGAGGDHTFFLREVLNHKITKRTLLTIVDPQAVRQAEASGVGTTAEFSLGGKLDRQNDKPVTVTAKIRTIFDGRYILQGRMYEGEQRSMGKTAVLDIKPNISVEITELPVMTIDPSHYWCVGLFPERAEYVLIKSQGSYKASYNSISRNVFYLDTPGQCTSNIYEIAYRNPSLKNLYPFNPERKFLSSESVYVNNRY